MCSCPITFFVNSFQLHIWTHNYDQGETSLIHGNTSGWCRLFSSPTSLHFFIEYVHWGPWEVNSRGLQMSHHYDAISKQVEPTASYIWTNWAEK